jgi:quinoprotein glucose dehydrogenase
MRRHLGIVVFTLVLVGIAFALNRTAERKLQQAAAEQAAVAADFGAAKLTLSSAVPDLPAAQKPGAGEDWPEYGGNAAGQRFSAARQITRENVIALKPVWMVPVARYEGAKPSGSFEATPVLWQGTLYFDTPRDVVMAVDAATGRVRWVFDPKVEDAKIRYIVTSRGVALWHDEAGHTGTACADRVFVATLDRRLIALDAREGRECREFGREGTVDLGTGIYVSKPELLEYTSPAVVVGDRVVLGSSVADNQTIDTPSGAVRGFDVRTGRPVWAWEPVRWVVGQSVPHTSGAGNAWAPLAADPDRDLIFVPTGSASVDYYGGTRPGDNRDADSIVALRASTGEKVWGFQLVHHNLWDYDTASQPLLFTWLGTVPAVAVMNKTGMIYVFNRLTGKPLFPIEERRVPQSTVPGENASATQPFSTVEPLLPLQFSADQMPAQDTEDERFCRTRIGKLDYQGPFTPPSLNGTIVYPAALGGPNWGSSALDPLTGVMYTRVNSMPYLVWLHKRVDSFAGRVFHYYWDRDAPSWLGGKPGMEEIQGDPLRPPDMAQSANDHSGMAGTPYTMFLRALISQRGIPCGGAPYGRLVATDLNTGKQLWSVPHGSMRPDRPGSTGMAGPLATAGGLVFVAATEDPFLRAYDAASGRELWKGELPAPGTATPMTYVVNGRQYVVIATGRENGGGDELVAFGLTRAAEMHTELPIPKTYK